MVPQLNSRSLLGAFETLKMVQSRLEMRKLWVTKVWGVKKSKNNHIMKSFSKHPKDSLDVVLVPIKIQDDL
jgi:hypothetical protein